MCSQCLSHTVCPHSQHVCFPCLHCLGSRLLCWELSQAGPGLYALPRSKSLRFRYSGTPQRRRLCWACVLCPSQVQQLRWPSAWWARSPPVEGCDLSPPPSLLLGFLGVQWAHLLRCALCLLGSWFLAATLPADVDRPESQEVLVSNEAPLQFGWWCLSGATIAPFWLWLPSSACLQWGMGQSAAS